MKTKHTVIRNHLDGISKTIQIGRSFNSAGFGTNTPITVMKDSDLEPELHGQPYLKTLFSNGRGFTKTLYTPSTLHVIVGERWLAQKLS